MSLKLVAYALFRSLVLLLKGQNIEITGNELAVVAKNIQSETRAVGTIIHIEKLASVIQLGSSGFYRCCCRRSIC